MIECKKKYAEKFQVQDKSTRRSIDSYGKDALKNKIAQFGCSLFSSRGLTPSLIFEN